ADANRITLAALSAWQANFGYGPFTRDPDHPQAVGGWYCYNWADLFKSAFDRVDSSCFSARVGVIQEGGYSFPWEKKKMKEVKIHAYLVITVGDEEGEGKCSVTLDDGFLNNDFVHMGNLPAGGIGPYKPPKDGQEEAYYDGIEWEHVVPFPVW
ncbi:hypothetical protein, partial [Stieleria varia]